MNSCEYLAGNPIKESIKTLNTEVSIDYPNKIEWNNILKNSQKMNFTKNEFIIKQNDPSYKGAIYIVQHGLAQVFFEYDSKIMNVIKIAQ